VILAPAKGWRRGMARSLRGLLLVVALGGHGLWAGTNLWTPNSPYGGWVMALAADPHDTSRVLAGTVDGVHSIRLITSHTVRPHLRAR
jgi:hypothetical protein